MKPAFTAETVSDPDAPLRHYNGRNNLAGVGERAQALVLEQLANVPKPATQIETAAEAAEIPERSLIAAVGVRAQRGQWWLPGT